MLPIRIEYQLNNNHEKRSSAEEDPQLKIDIDELVKKVRNIDPIKEYQINDFVADIAIGLS